MRNLRVSKLFNRSEYFMRINYERNSSECRMFLNRFDNGKFNRF